MNEQQTKHDAAAMMEPLKVAAAWWKDQIKGDTKFDNGDKSFVGLACKSMAEKLASMHQPTPQQLDVFEAALIRLEVEYFEKWGRSDGMHVDYGPGGTLYDAAQEAGIDNSVFPCKTNMWVDQDRVYHSAGYGAGYEVIWGKPIPCTCGSYSTGHTIDADNKKWCDDCEREIEVKS